MKKIIIIVLVVLLATGTGLYFRPSYPLIGQLDWWNVVTKGYFVGSFVGLFSQAFIDESFWFVMRFTGAGVIAGVILTMIAGGAKKSPAKKKK